MLNAGICSAEQNELETAIMLLADRREYPQEDIEEIASLLTTISQSNQRLCELVDAVINTAISKVA